LGQSACTGRLCFPCRSSSPSRITAPSRRSGPCSLASAATWTSTRPAWSCRCTKTATPSTSGSFARARPGCFSRWKASSASGLRPRHSPIRWPWWQPWLTSWGTSICSATGA
jgi:hypothetical protein